MFKTTARFVYTKRRLLGWALVALGFGLVGAEPASRLRARLPDPLNRNRHIVVITSAPLPAIGTPLLRLTPSLQVLGVVEGPAPDVPTPVSEDRAVWVSVFPEAERLIREDSEIVLRVTTPDLLEVVATHLTPSRRRRIAARARAWQQAHEQAIDHALDRARELAARELQADELGNKLRKDPVLRAAIADAFDQEVLSRIDWDRVTNHALESDAAESAGALLTEAGPASTLWAGLREGYRDRWSARWSGEEPPGLSIERLLSPLRLLAPTSRGARRGALRRASENVRAALPQHKAQLTRDLQGLSEELLHEHALEQKGLAALKHLGSSATLQAHLRATYGDEAWERASRLAVTLAEDSELQRRARSTIDSGLELLAGLLREILLDDAGVGPNPLVSAFIRARVLGKARPTLILSVEGAGAPVSCGQVFVSRRR